MGNHPTWLKVMQNGTKGEARAKAFLLDRFWILERSVDIDGADFIIQRRFTKSNILDRNPPRFGVIQVKFFDSEKTTHYIHSEYVIDNNDLPRDEFFLLCFTGEEDNSTMFFLTAKQIKSHFLKSNIDGKTKFRLYGKSVISINKFLVRNKKSVLDRIENQLLHADFTKNRQFLSWRLPNIKIDTSAILPDYKEPLNNWWGNIPDEFRNMKDTAYKALINIDEIYDKLKKITEETDPMKALEFAYDIKYHCNVHMQFQLPEVLYSEDFERACYYHMKQLNNLRNDGVLDCFLEIKTNLSKEIIPFLWKNLPFDPNTVHSIFIEFNTFDFSFVKIEQKVNSVSEYWGVPNKLNEYGHVNIPVRSYDGIKEISNSQFEYYWLPGRIHINEEFKDDLKRFYQQLDFRLYVSCMEYMYNSRY